jgi:prepilin-type N-terminal cleavage/methylation domain-containing protein
MSKFNPARLGKKQSGFTLLELLLVLGIIAVLAIAAFVIYPKVQASNRAQTESNNITTVISGVKSLYASTGDYTAVDTATVINAKIFPATMVKEGVTNQATSSFGTAVTVVPGTDAGADNNAFAVHYEGVPADVCQRLASGVGANFQDVRVGTSSVFSDTTKKIDPALVVDACKADNVAMDFVSN